MEDAAFVILLDRLIDILKLELLPEFRGTELVFDGRRLFAL